MAKGRQRSRVSLKGTVPEGPKEKGDLTDLKLLLKTLTLNPSMLTANSSDGGNGEGMDKVGGSQIDLENDGLMSEIGRLFFSSMVQFTRLITTNSSTIAPSTITASNRAGANRADISSSTTLTTTSSSGPNDPSTTTSTNTTTSTTTNKATATGGVKGKGPNGHQKYNRKPKPRPTTTTTTTNTSFDGLDTCRVDLSLDPSLDPTLDLTPNHNETQKLNFNIYRFINNTFTGTTATAASDSNGSGVGGQDKSLEDYPLLTTANCPVAVGRRQPSTTTSSTNDNGATGSRSKPIGTPATTLNTTNYPTGSRENILLYSFNGDLPAILRLGPVNLDFVDPVGRAPIHYACTSGSLPLVKHLINEGVDIDRRDLKGWTPLFISVVKGHVEIVRLLLERGADLATTLRHRCAPTRLTDAHSHAIHFAAIKSNLEITKLLLSKGVDVNERDSQGITPLSYSCYRANPQYVSYLLEVGGNPLIEDVNGRNSFHSLALSGSVELLQLFKERGLGVANCPDRWSLTPSRLADLRGHHQLSKLLTSTTSTNSSGSTTTTSSTNSTTNGTTTGSSVGDEDELYLLLSTSISSALNEANSDQIYRCIVRLGVDVVKTLFDLTLKVQRNGGVSTLDGKRARTPGGVFFTLLKQMHRNNYITREDYQYIRAAEKERKATNSSTTTTTTTSSSGPQTTNSTTNNNKGTNTLKGTTTTTSSSSSGKGSTSKGTAKVTNKGSSSTNSISGKGQNTVSGTNKLGRANNNTVRVGSKGNKGGKGGKPGPNKVNNNTKGVNKPTTTTTSSSTTS